MSFSDNERIVKGIAFEKAIIEVLKSVNPKLVCDSILPFYSNEKNDEKIRFRYDGYIVEKLNLSCFGMEDIYADRIIIEIKSGKIQKDTINEWYKRFERIFSDNTACFVLFLAGKKPEKLFDNYNIKCRLIVIDYNKLTKNKIIKKVLNSFDEYIIEENNVIIDDHYPSLLNLDNISFALGAGCSINSNISDWNSLSEALGFELLYNVVNIKDSAYKNMFITNELNKKIFGCYEKNSALDAIFQSYIDSPSVTQLDYFFAIKKVLYMAYDNPSDANTPLMTSINNCICRKRIKEVINYNFDSVLEQNYDNSYKSISYEIMNSQTMIGGCNVYHVHGYIPFDYDGKIDIANFVFTDKEYYENMIDRKNKCNSIQRDILTRNNVIFVGVSFTDANLKAILRERMEIPHFNDIYGFLKLPSFEGKGIEMKIMENKYKLIQQNYFKSLGVKILWVREFDEIPKVIDNIK